MQSKWQKSLIRQNKPRRSTTEKRHPACIRMRSSRVLTGKTEASTTRNEDKNYEKVDKKSGEEIRMELFGT